MGRPDGSSARRWLLIGLASGALSAAGSSHGSQDAPIPAEAERAVLRALPVPIGGDRRLRNVELANAPMLAKAAEAVGLVATTLTTGEGNRRRTVSDIGSGVLVTACLVLTARHVLGVDALDASDAALEAEVRFHLDGVRGVATYSIAHVAASGSGRRGLFDDWALLRLNEPVREIAPIDPTTQPCCSRTGPSEFALVGYPSDRFDALDPAVWIDPACGRPTRLANGMLATRCLATSGSSGGPLLILQPDGWRVVGILTRAPGPREGRGTAYVLPLHTALRNAIALEAEKPCAPPLASPPPEASEVLEG